MLQPRRIAPPPEILLCHARPLATLATCITPVVWYGLEDAAASQSIGRPGPSHKIVNPPSGYIRVNIKHAAPEISQVATGSTNFPLLLHVGGRVWFGFYYLMPFTALSLPVQDHYVRVVHVPSLPLSLALAGKQILVISAL